MPLCRIYENKLPLLSNLNERCGTYDVAEVARPAGPPVPTKKVASQRARRTAVHLDYVLLAVLAALAVWTEVDARWRRKTP